MEGTQDGETHGPPNGHRTPRPFPPTPPANEAPKPPPGGTRLCRSLSTHPHPPLPTAGRPLAGGGGVLQPEGLPPRHPPPALLLGRLLPRGGGGSGVAAALFFDPPHPHAEGGGWLSGSLIALQRPRPFGARRSQETVSKYLQSTLGIFFFLSHFCWVPNGGGAGVLPNLGGGWVGVGRPGLPPCRPPPAAPSPPSAHIYGITTRFQDQNILKIRTSLHVAIL